MPDLSSVTLVLKPQHDANIPVWLGQATQAHFFHTLEALHPDLSKVIHDAPGAKPFTSSTLLGVPRRGELMRLRQDETVSVRYTTLHPQLTAIFHQGMLPQWENGVILLHNQPLKVVEIQSASAEDLKDNWNQQTDYAYLLEHAATGRAITLAFSSPTAFKRTRGGFVPLPQPELVFSSLLDRWNAFAPFRLPEALYDTVHTDIVIDQAQLQTETVMFARGQKGTVTGFMGQVTYRLECSVETRRYLHALAGFAKYSSVGVKTSVGMGQIRTR